MGFLLSFMQLPVTKFYKSACGSVSLLHALLPLCQRAMVRVILNVDAIRLQCTLLPHVQVHAAVPSGEPPLLRGVDLLSTGELELGPPQRLHGDMLMLVLAPDGDECLTDVHSSH